jgi:hypothetical protein
MWATATEVRQLRRPVRIYRESAGAFALDAQPGQVHGNGVGDSFAGTHFTWHSAVPAGMTAPSAPASAPANNFPPGY